MNESNIDNLLRLAPALTDTSIFSLGRVHDDGPTFDRHLRDAGTTNPSPGSNTSSDAARRRDNDPPTDTRTQWSGDSDPNSRPESDDLPAAESSASDQPGSVTDDPSSDDATTDATAADQAVTAADARNVKVKKDEPKRSTSENGAAPSRRPGRKHAADADSSVKKNAAGSAKSESASTRPQQDPQSSARGTAAREKHVDGKSRQTAESHEHEKAAGPASKDVAANERATIGTKELQPQAVAAQVENADNSEQTAVAQSAENKHRDAARISGTTSHRKSEKSNRASSTREPQGKPAANRDATSAKQEATSELQPDADKTSAASATAATKTDKQLGNGDKESASEDKPTATRSRPSAGARPGIAAALPLVAGATAPVAAEAASKDTAAATGDKIQKVSADAKEGTLATFARYERATATGARGGQRSSDDHQAPQVDPARFISRVARAITTAQERGGPLHLRLSPPELGTLRLELSVKGGALTAHVEADNPTARQVLLDNLPALRDRLAEQNMRIERFDVDVRRDGAGDQPNFTPHDRQHQQQRVPSNLGGTGNLRRAGDTESADVIMPVRHAITDTSINLIV